MEEKQNSAERHSCSLLLLAPRDVPDGLAPEIWTYDRNFRLFSRRLYPWFCAARTRARDCDSRLRRRPQELENAKALARREEGGLGDPPWNERGWGEEESREA